MTFWRRNIGLSRLFLLLLGVALSSTLASCAYFNINNQVSMAHNSTILSGTVYVDKPVDAPIVIVAYSRQLGMVTIAHYAVIDHPGSWELLVNNGSYLLCAFVDRNRNLQFDIDEPAANYGAPDPVIPRYGGILTDLDISIPVSRNGRVDFPVGFSVQDERPNPFHSTVAGTLFRIDDPLFSLKAADRGYLAPVDFFRELGGNIYFLEPYSPTKIPVLFVHGALGSPENFTTFTRYLDRDIFQPWFFYYPSGASLTAMSNLLSKKISDLQRMYAFPQLHIVAHSMGGLVSRNFMVSYASEHPYVRTFISLCSPWGGVIDAENGVATSPFVLNSWRDIATGSEFVNNLYRRPLPEDMAFYLFFGFKGSRVPWKAYNDGTITLASQLDPRAQREARGTYGLNESHTSILENRDVINQIMVLLRRNEFDPQQDATASVLFRFSGLKAEALPSPFMAFLTPLDEGPQASTREEALVLDPLKPEQLSGAVAPGRYQLAVMAWGYRASPARIELDLTAGASAAQDVQLSPLSSLTATIRRREASDPTSVGLFPAADPGLRIESIQLSGPDTLRTLLPVTGERPGLGELYARYQDFYLDGRVVFFDLPPGKYQLSTKATGCVPSLSTYEVLPGKAVTGATVILEKAAR